MPRRFAFLGSSFAPSSFIRTPGVTLLALVVALGLSACSDDSSGSGSDNDPFGELDYGVGGGVPGGGAPTTEGEPDFGGEGVGEEGGDKPGDVPGEEGGEGEAPVAGEGGEGGADDQPGVSGKEIIFLHETADPLLTVVGDQITLSAKVIDYAVGGPAEGALVYWSITDAVGPGAPGDAELGNEATYTGPSGITNVILYANEQSEVIYRVEAITDGAAPRTILVQIDPLPTGTIRVAMTYEGPVPLNNVRVMIFPPSYDCQTFKPTNPAEPIQEKTVLSTDSQPAFPDLIADQKYTVAAIANGPNGNLAGAGCRDGVFLEPDEVAIVQLPLYVLVLNPSGTYDLDNTFDFTGAIPGQLGEILDTLAQLFYDPGTFLVDQIKNLVSQFLPSFITDAIFSLFEKQLAKLITDWVLNDAPDWIQDFFTIGQDLLQVVAKLRLTGDLTVSKLQNDYFVEGNIQFTGVVFSWKLGCDPAAPDYEECGQFPFSLEDVEDDDFPLDLIAGSWKGSISQYDQLAIEKHGLALNYGKLILFVLNDLILQELTGKDTFKEAVAAMLGCGSIAEALDDLGLFSADQIEEACVDAVGLLVLPIQTTLLGLETDSLVTLEGSATLRDFDNDLLVDAMEEGEWTGFVVVGGASGNPFIGFWDAIRE